MRRIGRWMINGLTVLSLVLCAAAVALWVRSLYFYDAGPLSKPGARVQVDSLNGVLAVTWHYGVGAIRTDERQGITLVGAHHPEEWVKIRSYRKDQWRSLDEFWEQADSPVWLHLPTATKLLPDDPWSVGYFSLEGDHSLSGIAAFTEDLRFDTEAGFTRFRTVTAPYWLFTIPALLLFAPRLQRWQRRRRRSRRGRCPNCNYNLTGNVSGVCPECGMKIAEAK